MYSLYFKNEKNCWTFLISSENYKDVEKRLFLNLRMTLSYNMRASSFKIIKSNELHLLKYY